MGLPMVLIEDVLTLLMMIEQPERKLTLTMAMAVAKQQSHTVLGVLAMECRLAIATIVATIDVSASNITSMSNARDNTMNN